MNHTMDMNHTMTRSKCLAAGLTALGLLSTSLISMQAAAQADNFPAKPVTIIVPYSPGSATETEVRIYAQKMTEIMGQSFLVEFKPGAGATLGAAYVAKAAPDGYTLLQVSSAFIIAPLLYKDLPYEPLRDFAPVSLMSKKPNVLLVNPAFPARTLGEYIAYARANPGKLNFATSGGGGPQHLVGAWLHGATDTKVTFIHYKGGAPSVTDLLAGRVDVLMNPLSMSQPMMQSGKMRALAVMSSERVSSAPDTPTVAEQVPTMKDFEYSAVIGIVAPVKTPPAVVNKLSSNFTRAAKSPDVIQKLAPGGSIMIGSTPEQFRQSMAAESVRFRQLIKDNDIRLEE
jgi:tripartite-type tricarboxylate transporter receptor subunit TctC